MNNITNKELTEQINNVYTAMFLLDEQREEIAASEPYDVDGSELETIMNLKAASQRLKEVADVLRKIRAYQATGYHA